MVLKLNPKEIEERILKVLISNAKFHAEVSDKIDITSLKEKSSNFFLRINQIVDSLDLEYIPKGKMFVMQRIYCPLNKKLDFPITNNEEFIPSYGLPYRTSYGKKGGKEFLRAYMTPEHIKEYLSSIWECLDKHLKTVENNRKISKDYKSNKSPKIEVGQADKFSRSAFKESLENLSISYKDFYVQELKIIAEKIKKGKKNYHSPYVSWHLR